jgi:alkylated DNA repair protein (DNA oxidative demethylase)
MMSDLFGAEREVLDDGALLLRGFAREFEAALMAEIAAVTAAAALRQMVTPGGHKMSVAMSNCGAVGWVTDRRSYRYSAVDPESGLAWPAMPELFARLAKDAAQAAGFADFCPDACLVNRYEPGAKMSLHQDRDERDFSAPIVSVSLGLPAVFLWGGKNRADKARRVGLSSGDVLVWGGESRLNFHGILPLKAGVLPCRFNLTFRKAG